MVPPGDAVPQGHGGTVGLAEPPLASARPAVCRLMIASAVQFIRIRLNPAESGRNRTLTPAFRQWVVGARGSDGNADYSTSGHFAAAMLSELEQERDLQCRKGAQLKGVGMLHCTKFEPEALFQRCNA